MNNKNLIIYQYHALYQIFKELEQELNFIIIEVKNKEFLTKKVKNLKNYIVISKKKIENIDCQLVLNNSPIKFSKLIEKINIEIIKKNFIYQSKFIIKDYIIDLNSREISKEEKCNGMFWQVLDWNKQAINFYKKYNATISSEWLNGKLDKKQIEKIISNQKI